MAFKTLQGNKVTGLDDEGPPMSIFWVYVIGDVKVWRQSPEAETSEQSKQVRAAEVWRQSFM